MNDRAKLELATAVVLRFATDWTEWESQMSRSPDPFEDPTLLARHAELIASHCTPKKRAYVDGLPNFGTPPTYETVTAANIMATELISAGKAWVDVGCRPKFYRFVVHHTRAGWRIDSLKWKVSEADNWSNGLIGM